MRLPLKRILLVAAVAVVAMQFIRPVRNLSTTPPGKNDIVTLYPPLPEVRHLLAVACYDCHSNNTRYPWYADVQPVGWWLKSHIDEGKDRLNFSEFGSYSLNRQRKKFGAIADQLTDRVMPLKSYTWIHRDAVLTDAQNNALIDWAESMQEKVEGTN
jgi:hypothetical protein